MVIRLGIVSCSDSPSAISLSECAGFEKASSLVRHAWSHEEYIAFLTARGRAIMPFAGRRDLVPPGLRSDRHPTRRGPWRSIACHRQRVVPLGPLAISLRRWEPRGGVKELIHSLEGSVKIQGKRKLDRIVGQTESQGRGHETLRSVRVAAHE